ncbi:MAG: YjbQ family protein [Chlorobi bacterium]|nr:YjbQ family protein [Chlorobiota bacterium]
MVYQKEIILPSYSRGFHLITDKIISALTLPADTGVLNIFIKHTSAGLTVNENADYTVREDFEKVFNKMVPENMPYYAHVLEGSDDLPAHVKASLTGNSLNIPVTDGRLNMGTWQGIYLCEFRNNGGRRKLVLTFYY